MATETTLVQIGVSEAKIKQENLSTGLQYYVEQARTLLNISSISIDDTQPSYFAWHSLISILAEHYAKFKPKQSKFPRETADLLLKLKVLINKVARDCPIETLRFIPESGTFAGKTVLYYFAEHDLFIFTDAPYKPFFLHRLRLDELNWQHKETGNTALMHAAHNNRNFVEALLTAGAAYDIRNSKGETARDMIRRNTRTEKILIWTEKLFILAEGLQLTPPFGPITNITDFNDELSTCMSEGGSILYRNHKGETPYDVAIAKGKLTHEMIKELEVTPDNGNFNNEPEYQQWAANNINQAKTTSALLATAPAPAVGTAEPLLYIAPKVFAPKVQETTPEELAEAVKQLKMEVK